MFVVFFLSPPPQRVFPLSLPSTVFSGTEMAYANLQPRSVGHVTSDRLFLVVDFGFPLFSGCCFSPVKAFLFVAFILAV